MLLCSRLVRRFRLSKVGCDAAWRQKFVSLRSVSVWCTPVWKAIFTSGVLQTWDIFESTPCPLCDPSMQMMSQRRADELYQNELAKYNEDNSLLTHAAKNERRWVIYQVHRLPTRASRTNKFCAFPTILLHRSCTSSIARNVDLFHVPTTAIIRKLVLIFRKLKIPGSAVRILGSRVDCLSSSTV